MSGGENGGVTAAQVCVRCGNPVSQATSYLTEIGLLCWPCFGVFQSEREQVDRRDAALQRSLTRRARLLAVLHGILLEGPILAVTRHAFPDLGWPLPLGVIAGLAIGLALRRRWAFHAALVLDTLAALGLAAVAIDSHRPLSLILEVFPGALLALAWTLRSAYAHEPSLAVGDVMLPAAPTAPKRKPRWPLLGLAVATLAAGGTATYLWRRARPVSDPALELMRTALPHWGLERNQSRSRPSDAKDDLVVRARRWPALAKAFQALDQAWPEETPVRAATASVNRALADAGLPYFASVWMVYDKPYVLSHALVARVPWHIGARTIEVLRLRRLDDINIDFAMDGVTQDGLPVVLLDRVEAKLGRELPAMYAPARELRASDFSDFDRTALARDRSFLEGRLGPGFARAVLALRERNRLLEEMRTRFHGDEVQLAVPDRLVLGDEWLETLEPSTRLDRPGGPLFLDTDLKAVVQADRALRDQSTVEAFHAAIELYALSTEAHEARHAAEGSERSAPPPSALFDVMPDSSTSMIGMADGELQAFLGELHDAALPACVNLAGIMRTVHGAFARREPHYYATLALLKQLRADPDQDPAQQLAALCGVADGELRSRVVAIWRRLYGRPMDLGERMGSRQ